MKNLIKKILGIHPEQLKITKIIEVGSSDPDVRIQEIRKRNLQLVIIKFYNSSILEYANKMRMHVFFIKGRLFTYRSITDKTARLIECHLRLRSGVLDEDPAPIIIERGYIPHIDIANSFSNQYLTLSSEKPTEYLEHNLFDPLKLLILDISELEKVLINDGFIPVEYGRILINRASEKEITIIKGDNYLTFNGEFVAVYPPENQDVKMVGSECRAIPDASVAEPYAKHSTHLGH